MLKLLSIITVSVLAIFFMVLGLSTVQDAIIMIYVLVKLNKVPCEYQTEFLWQAIRVISGTVLQLSIALWLAKRASTMWRARKTALAGRGR